MALITSPEAAARLARTILSDIGLYNKEKIKEGIKRNPVKKNHFELRYTRNRQRKPSDFLCIQVQFEEWDGLIVPFQVYIPPGEYGSEFSWIRSAPVVRNRYPIIALTNSRDIEVKLA